MSVSEWSNVLVVSAILVLCSGCNKVVPEPNKNAAKEIWLQSERDYFTSKPNSAYSNLTQEASQLTKLEKLEPRALDYDVTLAVVYGRLFILAEQLGKSDDAQKYHSESALRFKESRKKGQVPLEAYSKERIRALIAKVDESVRHKYENSGQ